MKRLNTTQQALLLAIVLGLTAILVVLTVRIHQADQTTAVATTPSLTDPTRKTTEDQQATANDSASSSDSSRLMADRNHNQAAAAYAHDITLISQYLKGEKTYTGDKLVFLTIDDGVTSVTEGVLDILKAHNVPATFFPIGQTATPEQAAIFRRQLKEGHAIGLHSYTHNLDLLYPNRLPDTDQIIWEAQESEKALKRLFGLRFHTRLWRYPGGAASWKNLEATHAKLEELDFYWLDWNANLGDAEPLSRRPRTLEGLLAFLQHTDQNNHESPYPLSPADIKVVLLHDANDKQLTLDALPHLIQYYKDRGYTFGVLY